MLHNELVQSYLTRHPDQEQLLREQVYPELLQLIKGLSHSPDSKSIATPGYVVAMIASKMILLGENPSPVTGATLAQHPDQNTFDFDIPNPFWSEQRVFRFHAAITQIIGEQPPSTISAFFKHLCYEAIQEIKK